MDVWESRGQGKAPQHIATVEDRLKLSLETVLRNAQSVGHAKGYKVAVIFETPSYMRINLFATREAMFDYKARNCLEISRCFIEKED